MKTHEPDMVSLISGLVFLILVTGWVLAKVSEIDLPPVGWIFALLLMAIGTVGLAGVLRPKRLRQ